MDRLSVNLPHRETLLRAGLVVAALILALILANVAASLYQVWQLNTGAAIPEPWSGLLRATRVTQRAHLVSLLGVALSAGASLACLVFVAERVIKEGYAWIRRQLGK